MLFSLCQMAHLVKPTRLPPLPSIRDIIRLYQLQAKKELAQNFLLDMDVCRKFSRAAGNLDGAYVIEVGSGPGGITRALLEQNVAKLVVVEKDRRFLPGLELLADASDGRMEIVHGDVLKYDFNPSSFPKHMARSWYDNPPKVFVFGNLPFNIATPLIISLLSSMSERTGPFVYGRTKLCLTFQKEVGERMAAKIMDPQRCRLSPMCQYLAHVQERFTIKGTAFVPKPEVDAAVMLFTPLQDPHIKLHFRLVERFCRHLFQYRQKFCIKAIGTLFPESTREELANEVLRRARVSPRVQCTKISVDEIRDMCHVYEEICRRHPGLFYYDFRYMNVPLEELVEKGLVSPPEYKFKQEFSETL